MARPTTKLELIQAGNEQFRRLWELIDSMDVLVHLYEWHQLLLNWVAANQSGNEQPFLPPPYNWKSYGKMNEEFTAKYQNTSYEDAADKVRQSHAEVMELIDTFSDEALFTKKYFPWTGTTSLGSYCVSATSSHYDWAIKKIKKHIKTHGAR